MTCEELDLINRNYEGQVVFILQRGPHSQEAAWCKGTTSDGYKPLERNNNGNDLTCGGSSILV